MPRRLREASFQVVEGHSVVVPLVVDGLPAEIEALGRRWPRKHELHMTVVSAKVLERAGGGREDLWTVLTQIWSGRTIGPIEVCDEVRRAGGHPDRRALETLVVMVGAPGLAPLYADLAAVLGVALVPPPAHVTLYSSDPRAGIGIDDERELAERAPPLAAEQQQEVRRAISFETVFGPARRGS